MSCKKRDHARKNKHMGTLCDGVTLQYRVNNRFLCDILIIVSCLKLSTIYQMPVHAVFFTVNAIVAYFHNLK